MRDYWLTQYLLASVGWTYIIVVLIATALALKLPKSKRAKVWATVIVIGLSSILPLKGYQGYRKNLQETNAYKVRLEKAQALFAERCKTAGEKIYRTVENVDGVLLLKVRPEYRDGVGSDPMYPGAALIQESGGEGYIASFLRYERMDSSSPERTMQLSDRPTAVHGYRFVEAVDPSDGKRYRYTKVYGPDNFPPAEYMPTPALKKELVTTPPPRYAVTYEDLVDPGDRKHWVAGTVLRVLDTKTNEVIAEQTRYLFDTGLGNTAGFRNPWGWASSYVPGCSKDARFYHSTRFFVDQILKPVKGE